MSKFHPDKPWNDLPALPPKAEVETRAILKQCILARSALAELKQAAELIPNQTILINTIPLLEAKDSSEIENIVTTTDELFKHAQREGEATDPATRETLLYRKALYEGYESLRKRPLNTNTAVRICSIIKGTDMQIRRVPGTALANQQTAEIIYTPPEGEALLRDKLANWERFLHEQTEIDPLIRLAVAHYQFEAIHPFIDGNGRTGRILNILFLIHEGLLTLPILYLSRYIIQNKNDYYRLLLNVTTEDEWEPWILYMLKAVQKTSDQTREKIEAIRALMHETTEHVKNKLPGIYRHELVELLFNQPYCRISNLVEAEIAKRQTASEYLKKLVEIKVLQEIKAGRENLYINKKLLALLKEN